MLTTLTLCYIKAIALGLIPASCDVLQPPPPSSYTEPYSAEGFFTGVRSTVTIQRSPSIVYDSLSKDLHHIFTPITVRLLIAATIFLTPLS